MNKIFIGIGLIIIATIGWFLTKEKTVNHVEVIDDQVSSLETELAEIETAVRAGELTPQEAAQAQIKIVSRIEAINLATVAGQMTGLSDAQRVQLVAALERLKLTLIKYQITLMTVDEKVLELPESERPKLSRAGKGERDKPLVSIVAEAIAEVEEQIENIIEDITDEELATELADSVSWPYVSEDETTTSGEEVGLDGVVVAETSTGGLDITNEESAKEVSGNTEEPTIDNLEMEENPARD